MEKAGGATRTLREHAGLGVLNRVRSRNPDLAADEALALAHDELHAVRRDRSALAKPN